MLANDPTKSKAQIELRLRLPLLWFAILLAAALLLPDRVWNTLLVGLGGLFVIAYAWVRFLANGLHAARRLRFGWVAVGDRLEEHFELVNHSPVPALWVEIVDHSNVPGYRAAVVRSAGGGEQKRWRESAVCSRRGHYTLGPWTIRSSDPFGIFMVTRHYAATSEIIIHPPIHGQLPIPLPAGQSSGRARARRRDWQATANAAAVRDYHPADPYRWIHWPTTARRDALYVREFDLDAAGDIWIVLDLQAEPQLGDGADSTEEVAVLLAASLAARALRQNRAVGLAAYGQAPQVVPPGRGQGQQWKLLRALALVSADGQLDLAAALRDVKRAVRPGTAAVIITAAATAGWLPDLLSLAPHGVQSNVILLDRPSFGGEGNSEGLRDAIRHLGLAAHVIHQGDVGQPLPEQQRGDWNFRVTGLGKVIAVTTPANM